MLFFYSHKKSSFEDLLQTDGFSFTQNYNIRLLTNEIFKVFTEIFKVFTDASPQTVKDVFKFKEALPIKKPLRYSNSLRI